MTTAKRNETDEAEIRKLVDDWAKALRAKDVNGVVSHYTPNILSFDLAPPLQHRGAEVLRKDLAEWFATFHGPIGYEIRDLNVTTGDDVAFGHSLNRISGKRTNGEETGVWVRSTVCFRKIDGKWRVTHEHASVPFYMEPPYKASLDLEP